MQRKIQNRYIKNTIEFKSEKIDTLESRSTRPFFFALSFLTFLFLLFLLHSFPSITYAQEPSLSTPAPSLAGTAPVPLEGDEDVVFVSQSVDITVSRAIDGQYWADVQAAVRLHNTSALTPADLKFGWPGWGGDNLRFDLIELADFKPIKDGEPLTTTIESRPTSWDGEEKESRWVVSQITMEPDKRQRIYFDWRQPIGKESLLTYSFALQPAKTWEGLVGSARITLKFSEFTNPESLISVSPVNYTFTGDKIEWLMIDQEPIIDPKITFLAPHVWQEIEDARSARATDPLQANLRLADLYEQLLELGINKYEGEIEATLNAAYQAAPNEVEPIQRLAALYQARAAQQPNNLALLEQAVMAGEAAFALGAEDEKSRNALIRDLSYLATQWAENDPNMALDFLNRAEIAGADATGIEKQRRVLGEKLVSIAIEQGELEDAFSLAQEYDLTTETAAIPWLTSTTVQIDNSPNKRLISFIADGEAEILDQKLALLANNINQMGYLSTWEPDTGTLTIQFEGNNQSWLESGNKVASFLRDEPELELLRAALLTNPIQYRRYEDQFYQYYDYREQVQVENQAQNRANQIREQATGNSTGGESAWQQYLLNESASAWQQLADSQRFGLTTHFEMQNSQLERTWSLTIPTNETLEWSGDTPRHDRWLMIALSSAIGLLCLLGLIWLPGAGR